MSRPLIASQPQDSDPAPPAATTAAPADSSPPQPSPGTYRVKASARKHRLTEPREWFARLRIREDRLAKLWVANLTSRDVVVWSPKEKRWVAMLAVPELRQAIKKSELDRASNPRSVVERPSHPSQPRLSQPPGSLPPTPPPPLRMTTHTSTAGELRLKSIAQDTQRAVRDTADANRASRPLGGRTGAAPRRSTPDYYHSSLDEDAESTRQKLSRWSLRAAERLLWMATGALLVLVLSSKGSSNEESGQFAPAKYIVAADETGASGSADAGSPVTTPDDVETLSERAGNPVVQPSESVAQDDSRRQPDSESRAAIPRNADRPPASQALSPSGAPAEPPGNGDLPRPTTTKLKSHVPAFLRDSVESSPPIPGIPQDFDFSAARSALIQAASHARACPGTHLSGKAIVTFDPSGHARAVDLPLVIGDGADRDCVARTFKTVRVPPFTGGAVAVKKDF